MLLAGRAFGLRPTSLVYADALVDPLYLPARSPIS